ncbi:MAG: TolC family protein, partial [Candidatus Binatia bacterium]
AWVRYTREQARRTEIETSVAANRDAVELANRLYANGLVDFLAVLDAERSLLAAERLLVRSNAAVSANVVALYVALGGGWPVERTQR